MSLSPFDEQQQLIGLEVNKKDEFIKVSVRIRPPDSYENNLVGFGSAAATSTTGTGGSLCLRKTDSKTVSLIAKKDTRNFSFDVVFDQDATQEYVFTSLGKHIIDGCIDGYNGTIFAYGQTGSGKTYTMIGPCEAETGNLEQERRGLIPRSLDYLFMLIERKKELQGDSISFVCRCSFVELYQEQVFDLLDPSSTTIIREDIKKGVYVQGAQEESVSGPEEAYQVLKKGWRNRKVASTAMNRESSRSHAVFCIAVESREQKGGLQNIKIARLNLVDLAGSERQKDASTTGQRLKEAGSINNSLSVLGKVINALVVNSQGKQRFVSYRDSRLTFLLRDSLGGNARTCIVCNIHPHSKCYGESLSTLQFADSAKRIRNNAVVNEDVVGQGISHLQAEIARLKEENRRLIQQRLASPSSFSLPQFSVTDSCQNSVNENEFLEALRLLRSAEAEKEGLQRMSKILRDNNARKDKQLLSCQLILKLRDSRIQCLEKALKEREMDETLKDRFTSGLLEEITELKNQLEHQGSPLRYKRENEELKRQMDDLKATEAEGRNRDALMKKFHQWIGPSHHDHVEVQTKNSLEEETLETEELRLKNHQLEYENEKLLKELEEVKRGHADEIERYKKSLDELKRSLTAGNLRREVMNTIHEDSIKALTPPQNRAVKSSRKSRRTTLYTPGTGSSEMPVTSSLFTPKRSILMPVGNRVEEEEGENLPSGTMVEQIRRLEELIAEQEDIIAKLESEKLTAETDCNRLQQQVNERQARINAVQEESEKREHNLCQTIADLELGLRKATEKNVDAESVKARVTELEKKCGKLGKEFQQKQKELDAAVERHRKEISVLENEEFKRASELNLARKEKDESLQEKAELMKRLDTATAELQFAQEQVETGELEIKRLNMERGRLRTLRHSQEASKMIDEMENLKIAKDAAAKASEQKEEELRAAQSAYLESVERERSLKLELEKVICEKENSGREMGELLHKNEQLKEESERLSSELSRTRNKLEELEATKANQNAEIEKVTKKLKGVEAEKMRISELNSLYTASRKQLDEANEKLAEAYTQADERKKELELVQRTLKNNERLSSSGENDKEAIWESELEKKESECDRLKEINERSSQLIAEYEKSAGDNAAVIEQLRKELDEQKLTRNTSKSDDKFRKKISELEKEKASWMKRADAAVNVSADIQKSVENGRMALETWKSKFHEQNSELTDMAAELVSLKQSIQRVQSSEERMFGEKQALKSALNEIHEEKLVLTKKLEEMSEKLDSEIHKNAELAGHANQSQKIRYLEKLRTENKNLHEENANLKLKLSSAQSGSSGQLSGRRGSFQAHGKENSKPHK